MPTPFKLGGGIGSGCQFWSWVSLEDVAGAIHHVIDNETIGGVVNCSGYNFRQPNLAHALETEINAR